MSPSDVVMKQSSVTPDRLSEPQGEGWQPMKAEEAFRPWKGEDK